MPRGKTTRSRAKKKAPVQAKATTRLKRGATLLARDEDDRYQTSVHTVRLRQRAARREVAAVIAAGVGALVLASLLSYHPKDSLVGVFGESGGDVRNWIGPFGAWLAEATVSLLGLTAFAAPLLLLLLAVGLLQRRHRRVRIWESVGFIGVMASLALAVELVIPSLAFRGGEITGGGFAGSILEGLLRPRLSDIGTCIVGFTALLVSSRVAFGLRPLSVLRTLGRRLRRASEPLVAGAEAGKDSVGRGLTGLVGHVTGGVREAWHDWQDERSIAREEARWLRKERLARIGEQEMGLEPDGSVQVEAVRIPSEIEAAPNPEPSRRESSVGVSRRPSNIRKPVALAKSGGSLGRSLVAPLPVDVEAVRFEPLPAPEPELERVDSMRGATARGVVHAELRLKGKDAKTGAKAAVPAQPSERSTPAPKLAPRIVAPAASAEPSDDRVASARRWIHKPDKDYELPGLDLLDKPPAQDREIDEVALQAQATRLEETLSHYNVEGRVTDILPGPVVTMFEFEPAPGIKVSRIAGLENDLAMALKALKVRIVAPIPGKGAVGIEVPSPRRETVYLREIMAHREFRGSKKDLPLALGKGIDAAPVTSDMAKMPHILVAGTTGSGKSVCVNSIILSLVFSKTPEDVRLILVDPKMLEFSIYDGIPHLLVPVVTSPKKAAMALNWAVEEMTRRYKVLAAMNTRGIKGYNEKAAKLQVEWDEFEESCKAGRPLERPDCGRALGADTVEFRSKGGDPWAAPEKMPYIVIIIDELADLMMVARKDVEESIVRLAQMARAAGIHMLLATQRPSVDVITGLIKANFPTRLSFKVSSKVDSRTVLDANGAENLLGMGDGLFLPPGVSELTRVHGAFVSDEEVQRVVDHLKEQGEPQYIEQILVAPDNESEVDAENRDTMYDDAVAVVAEAGKASTSLLQRRLKLGYNRAARIIDAMEAAGVVGPADGARPREVFIRPFEMP